MALNDPTQPAQPAPAMPAVYKAKQMNAALPEYDAMRNKLAQRTSADTQQQQDAMQRRFAAQGGLNSGAAIKQQQLVAETGVQQREQGMEAINTQEGAEQRRMQEAENQKEFQSQEAGAGRQFAASESQLGREHARGMFDDNQKFQEKWNTIGQSNTLRQLDMQAEEMKFNKASAMSSMSDDELDSMGDQSAAFREQKASIKGERENAKNRANDSRAAVSPYMKR